MSITRIEDIVAQKYKYKALAQEMSDKYRKHYRDTLPGFLCMDGGGKLYTKRGCLICESYERIVIGDYGAYVEFSSPACAFVIEKGQEYRVDDERYSKNVKYVWETINDGSHIKIYHQKKPVDYADYKPGMYYVSVHDVTDKHMKGWSQ